MTNGEYRGVYAGLGRFALDLVAPLEREFFETDDFERRPTTRESRAFYDVLAAAWFVVGALRDEFDATTRVPEDVLRSAASDELARVVASRPEGETPDEDVDAALDRLTRLVRATLARDFAEAAARGGTPAEHVVRDANDALAEAVLRRPGWSPDARVALTLTAWNRVLASILERVGPGKNPEPDKLARLADDALDAEVTAHPDKYPTRTDATRSDDRVEL